MPCQTDIRLLIRTAIFGGERPFAAFGINGSYARWFQRIDATHALKRSAGGSYPSVFRGRSLSSLAIAIIGDTYHRRCVFSKQTSDQMAPK
ncbi:MAG: hypothetical protein JKY45_08265 [Emcibacter sp.]|nr:hypothetical protein [Emcibacter sp.]